MREALGSSAFTSGHLIRRFAPAVAAALLAGAYLIVRPTGADLPAQLLRVKLFSVQGFGLWDNWWYGGHYTLGYSVLFPPLGWLLGPRLLAALAGIATAAACGELARDCYGQDAWVGATWLGAATVTEPLSGRLTFALGLSGAAVTALLLERRRPRWAAVPACLTALSSPVAGLFVALTGAAVLVRGLKRRNRSDIAGGIAVISVQIVLLGALSIAFPTTGYQPFAFGALWPLLAAGVLVVGLRPGPVITTATVLYLLGCLAAFAIRTPLGSNAVRLGDLLAGPLVALLLVPRRAWALLALAALPLGYLQLHDAIGDLRHGSGAASARAYYLPLIRYLHSQPGAWRVEVPFTAGHWESYWLAAEVPLARGWERQTDIADNALFYQPRLTAARYDAWLHRLAVRYVAVSDAPADYSARAELRLIRDGLPYLRRVRRLRHWTVYAVSDPSPLVSGARLLAMGSDSLSLAIARPGTVDLSVRWSPYWRLSGVPGCVVGDGRFTRIIAGGAGRAQLRMSFSPGRVGSRGERCD